MKIIDELKDWFKDKKTLVSENAKIRCGKEKVEKKYESLLEENSVLSEKYVALLEEKSSKFDLYVEYQEKCIKLAKEKARYREMAKVLSRNQKPVETSNKKKKNNETKPKK